MTNTLYRSRLIARVAAALAEYQAATLIDHNFLMGRIREIAVQQLLLPLLSSDFAIGTGKISDSKGTLSSEMDLIIHSKRLIAPLLHSTDFGVYPAESTLAAVEVKSTLNATELQTSLTKAASVNSLVYTSGQFDEAGTGTPHDAYATLTFLFGFKSDLSTEDELTRYKRYDDGWATNPIIRSFCVPGRGYWSFNGAWRVVRPTPEHDEVISFLTQLVNGLLDMLVSRGHPRIGAYLSLEQMEPVE